MLIRLLKSSIKSKIAKVMLCIMVGEILIPLKSFALTSGPSQPEMQSFEPVGTTDLVDPFSGDFNYNIPLMDVEGYPINIAYHSGINMDQEASWVGLGWNINPGNITHNVRGIPDDFNGDSIEKTFSINPEMSKKFSGNVGAEVFGAKIPVNIAFGMNFSNYSGISANLNAGFSVRQSFPGITVGANFGLGVSTDQGADFDYNLSLSKQSKLPKSVTNTITGSFGQQFNSRQGLMATTYGASSSGTDQQRQRISSSTSFHTSYVPISQSNFVPVITNAAFTSSKFFQIKIGGELWGGYAHIGVDVGLDKTEFQTNGTRNAFGYMYLQNARKDDITDFTRDRDGRFNRKMKYLPSGSMTYDVYNVSGQGTSGNFRPFRSDVGVVYDPYVSSDNQSFSVRAELGLGTLIEAGADFTDASTHSVSGPWEDYTEAFKSKEVNSLHEPYYFKQAGELTLSKMSQSGYSGYIKGKNLLKGINDFHDVTSTTSPFEERVPRANLMYFSNGQEASSSNVSLLPKIPSYSTPGYPSTPTYFSRNAKYRKAHHISEVTQLLPDGRRYIYGIPAMNIEQIEYVASVDATGLYSGNVNGVIDGINPAVQASQPGELGQKFHMKSVTPAHAHSYLLTSVLSTDYTDLTGDGITDDDLGEYTKFNYTLKDDNYKWRTPYKTGRGRLDMGARSDCHDDKATVVMGRKEIWMLHSIESRNYIAEFHISPRVDGAGSNDPLISGAGNNFSYKLDKIVLYNKQDRKINGNNAFPIKTVLFTYDYSLCKGVPNVNAQVGVTNVGKLTLKAISIRNGNSDIGLLSPYRFDYGRLAYNPQGSVVNPDYDEMKKDVWGEYKEGNGTLNMSNFEFPYVDQNDLDLDQNAFAWNLTQITVPSGGTIEVQYESDDYAYVQDKRAMEMFKVEGVGYSTSFDPQAPGNFLFKDKTSPALYIYFKRKPIVDELYPNNITKSYLDGITSVQYNFEVKINSSGETTPSCGIPLQDNIKGYADIESCGICDDPLYAYIKILPKYADATGKLLAAHPSGPSNLLILNPIAVSAIHYAQYYNNKALNPASELLDPNPAAILRELGSALSEYANYVRNPMISHIKKSIAKEFNIGRSYIRLQSQGKKKGGGHRVKQVKSTDKWDQMGTGQSEAIYGTRYNYTTLNEAGKEISSGVATYEPLVGGDENPLRNRVHTDRIGNKRVFPMTEPIELIVEEPLGESLFPTASVGYSKVTVSSIHKDVAQSAQVVQQHEYYTAKDFPVRVENSDLEKWVDEYPKKINFQRIKRDILRVAQSYVITLNDMHGKQKATRTLVDKGGGKMQEVAHTYYNYFTEYNTATNTNTIKNEIPCASWNGSQMAKANKELGVEVDFTIDSREKVEKSRTWGLNINTNTILAGIIPLPIPMPIPQIPKGQDRIFSSVVATKIVQQYGVLKSVETFDKGATLIVENDLFDAITGQALITKVNTEHKDNEYSIKRPAYWAYNSLGPAYENIHYEHSIGGKASIVNDKCYIYLSPAEMARFNLGDELEITLGSSCLDPNPSLEKFKLWVVDKSQGGVNLPQSIKDKCAPQQNPCAVPNYWYDLNYTKILPQPNSGKVTCFKPIMAKNYLQILARDPLLAGMNIEKAEIIFNPSVLRSGQAILLPPAGSASISNATVYSTNDGVNFSPSNLLGSQISPSIPINSSIALRPYAWGQGIPSVASNNNHEYDLSRYDFTVQISAGYQNAEKFQTSTKLIKYTYSVKYSPEYYLHGLFNSPNANLYKNTTYSYLSALGLGTVADLKSALEGSNAGQTIPSNVNPNPNTVYINYHSNDVVPDIYKDANSFLTGFQSNYVGYGGLVNNALPSKAIHYPNPNDPIFKDINFTLDVYVPWVDGTPMPNAFSTYLSPWTNPLNFTFKNLCELGSPGYFMPAYHNLASGISGPSIPSFSNFTSIQGTTYMTRINVNEITRESVTVIDRDAISDKNNTPALVCLPLKRMAKASNTETPNNPAAIWPSNDSIYSATIKVIRSGKKNRMMENAETATALAWPYSSNILSDMYNRLLAIEATDYTDDFHLPDELNDPTSVYFNPYAVGGKGYYLPYKGYQYHANREYGVGGIDKDKGIINSVPSFWMQGGVSNTNKHRYMQPAGTTNFWQPKYTVLKYDPWGRDVEVRDASGNINCNLFGYNNRLPIAVVSNSKSDNSLFENFEDYDPNFFNHKFINYIGMPGQEFLLTLLQSPLKKIITDNLATQNPLPYLLSPSAHTGVKALECNSPAIFPMQFVSGALSNNFNKPTLYPFSFKPEKYIINYWQKVTSNTTPPLNGALKLNINGNNFFAKTKSPVIDGWVLYEAIVDATVYANQSITNCDLNMWTSATIDDLRIFPYQSNMKAYVYHPENKRLLAVLDENHMSTRFDYSAEGKLVRIKKETEKGILTLKESRESLNNIVAPLQINSTYNLSDPNSVFQPLLPPSGIGTVMGENPLSQ